MYSCVLMLSSTRLAVTVLSAVISFALVSEGCFIRNCPKGGKRSLETSMMPQRECMKCGPGALGQCVGPSICCSPHFGCHVNTEDSDVCQQENRNTMPCSVIGQVCGPRDTGRCVADGVCCDSESCSINDRCILTREKGSGVTNRSEVLQLIEKLLRSGEYD